MIKASSVALVAVILIVAVAAGSVWYVRSPRGDAGRGAEIGRSQTVTIPPVTIDPVSHATFVLTWGTTVLYNDPVGGAAAFAGEPAPDVILVSHAHQDHFSAETIAAVIGPRTVLLAPQSVIDKLPADLAARAVRMNNGDTHDAAGITLTALPAYNLPETPTAPHKKGTDDGYVLEKDGERIYIAGDTSGTPEMRGLRDIDIAFVPMNPPYTMSVQEAADAVLAFAPRHVLPYHYRGPDGLNDVAEFRKLVNAGNAGIDVVLRDWYPAK